MAYFGYGSDEDAWIVGQEGLVIWNSGVYTISRSTGFPLHELLMAPLSASGKWFACNAFSVFCGIVVLVLVFIHNKIQAFRNPIWLLAGMAFLPQILVNASSTLDYLPSLACWMGMYYFVLRKKYYAAAILVGLACGFRPSNGAYILPVCLILFLDKEYHKSVYTFLLAFFCGIIAYSPVLINYGILDPTREVTIPWLQNLMIGTYQFLILFGVWQTILIGCIFILNAKKILELCRKERLVVLHVSSIIFWLIFFFGITSSEAEYLFPIIPSVLYLLDRSVSPLLFKITTASLLSYNVFSLEILGGESGNRKMEPRLTSGFTIRDFQDRKFKLWFREAATEFRCTEKTLLMFGSAYVLANNPDWEYAPGYTNVIKQKEGNFYVSERILDPKQLQQLKTEGIQLYVWNKRKWEYLRLNVPDWEKYVIVVEDLEAFLGKKKHGELMQ
jgi:hypothetical protein